MKFEKLRRTPCGGNKFKIPMFKFSKPVVLVI